MSEIPPKFFKIFDMETPLVFFFEKIIVYMAGKILTWPKFGHLLLRPITLKRCYESSLFLVWNIFLWSPLRKSYSICRENFDMAKL